MRSGRSGHARRCPSREEKAPNSLLWTWPWSLLKYGQSAGLHGPTNRDRGSGRRHHAARIAAAGSKCVVAGGKSKAATAPSARTPCSRGLPFTARIVVPSQSNSYSTVARDRPSPAMAPRICLMMGLYP